MILARNIFFLLPCALFGAQAPIYMAPPGATISRPKEEKAVAAIVSSPKGSSDIMIISPEKRASDIKAAIQYLNHKAPTSKPSIHLKGGETISGVSDVDVMPGGTILIFKINSLKGVQYKVVNIEDIEAVK